MKKYFKFAFLGMLTVVSTALFVSCSSDDDADTTKPVIDLHEPEDGEEILIGDEHGMHIEMDLSDNEQLSSYKINIHNNFDGHEHPAKAAAAGEVFEITKVYDISGLKNTHIHLHDIIIPETAAPGKYHLMVYCTDKAGNETYVARNIVLSHDAEEHHHEGDHDHEN